MHFIVIAPRARACVCVTGNRGTTRHPSLVAPTPQRAALAADGMVTARLELGARGGEMQS